MTETPTTDMPEMSKTFNFNEAEPRIYAGWESAGYFKPEAAATDAPPFVIAIPPPNVTGELHLGHALFVSLQDLMIRYERMRGKAALWIPGTDHASIATQLQVEKMLLAEGTSREKVGREEFLRRTWEWSNKYGGAIIKQFRRLGASADWSRLRFTMDESLSIAVREAFVTLYEQGLIYRGPRLINWSPGLQTAVSDLEVERSEEEATLYYFKYPVDGGEFIPVATTRPETILGDTAVAVHPEDERYKHLIGKNAYVPITNRPIRVIGDEYVDRAFGTGALKVTPAHDFNDYDLSQRHNLPLINIMNKDASLNDNGGPYAGLDRYVAREKLWADMTAAGLTIKTEKFTHVVPRTQRGGEIVEPLLSVQWFTKMQPLADKALAAVRDGQIKIVPERFEKVYFNWLENIRDWCISRQLWWGHRIPAFYCENGHITVVRDTPLKCATCGNEHLHQDEDVLDTWFSSGLWPFSTLGWPTQTPDYERFYPTDVLETGDDLLFFWVARMIMMGLWLTDKAPFHTVYLHGLVLDEHGDKMSKTKGNVIDPMVFVEKYGVDALRFTLITGSTPGNSQSMAESKIEYSRNFSNKLWQIAKFVLSNLGDTSKLLYNPTLNHEHYDGFDDFLLDGPSCWILSRLTEVVENTNRLFETYQYGEAGRQIQDFVWNDFADWYVEISKEALYGGGENTTYDSVEGAKEAARETLLHVLEMCLRLLHPFMPYVTEAIWQYLPGERKALIVSEWPTTNLPYKNGTPFRGDYVEIMETIRDLVVKVRNVRNEYKVEPGKRLNALVADQSGYGAHYHSYIFSRLCNIANVEELADKRDADDFEFVDPPANSVAIVSGSVTLYLPLADMVDFAAERERLNKELIDVTAQIDKSEKMLGNEGFVSRAKPEVVTRERARLSELTQTRTTIQERIGALPA